MEDMKDRIKLAVNSDQVRAGFWGERDEKSKIAVLMTGENGEDVWVRSADWSYMMRAYGPDYVAFIIESGDMYVGEFVSFARTTTHNPYVYAYGTKTDLLSGLRHDTLGSLTIVYNYPGENRLYRAMRSGRDVNEFIAGSFSRQIIAIY